jgi:hypothetical protein
MAKIAKNKIIWQGAPKVDKEGNAVNKRVHGVDTGEPDLERMEIAAGSPIPKSVPQKWQDKWQEQDLVYDDPNIEAPETQEGPPNQLLPIVDPKRTF